MRISLLLIALLGSAGLRAQSADPPLSISLDSAHIAEFVREAERQTGVFFYYDARQFDSLRISVAVRSQPLSQVLRSIFTGTDYYYYMAGDKKVFLTRGSPLQAGLPAGYFDPPGNRPANQSNPLPDYKGVATVKNDPGIEQRTFEIGARTSVISHAPASIAGYVRNGKTGEPIGGAYLNIEGTNIGINTDQYGYYSFTVPRGSHILQIQGIGMADTRRKIIVYADGKFNIDLTERVTSLKEVIVSAAKVANVRRVAMGVDKINIQAIKKMPSAFGEADILRAVITLPGVKTVGEASTGFNVRGGSADQNLILFNDATIFNPSHFFGFFSAFNPDVVKDVELYKSSIPAEYGGRLSSVLNITSREGNKKTITGSAGVGPVTARANVELPVIKDKMSVIAGGRATYANWLLNLLPDQYSNSKANFYDGNLLLHYQPNNKDNVHITGYLSEDKFKLNNDTSYGYNNRNVSAKWKHNFSNKLIGELTTGYDSYAYRTASERQEANDYSLRFAIAQFNAKTDFTWFVHPKHTLDMGVSFIRYHLDPGTFEPEGKNSLVIADKVPAEQAREMAAYISDRWNISTNLSVQAGLRYSYYNYLGPATVNEYAPGQPKTTDSQTGTTDYAKGKTAASYGGPEIRLSARYSITGDLSVKAGYNSQRQYIHMLSNTTAISPTDIWKLSDPNIKPQFGEQVSLGLYKNFHNNSIETSVEVYYKKIRNYLDYRSGASLVMNHHIETDVMGTQGKAYGVELMIKKQAGKLNGWLGYTWSRILLQQTDPNAGEIINGGNFYPANYDKPHDVTAVGNYKFSHRFSVSMNATYSTGRPITLPIGRFYYAGGQRALFGDRNAHRIPDYFRMDVSLNIDGNHKVDQTFHNSWTIGLYNLTGRHNAYSVYYVTEGNVISGYKLSIFGSIIPFINYNIRF